MASLILGRKPLKTFDGETYYESVTIEATSAKAVLVKIEKRGQIKSHWIPRSLCHQGIRPQIRIIDGKPVEQGLVEVLYIVDWFYEKEILGASK